MDNSGKWIFAGLVVIASAIFFNPNGKYSFAFDPRQGYIKFNTRTGEALYCSIQLETCFPLTASAIRKAEIDAQIKADEDAVEKKIAEFEKRAQEVKEKAEEKASE